MNIEIPELALVLVAGASGSGKSTFAAKHFAATEIVASDNCRAMVADDPSAQSATQDAFALLGFIADIRLRAGRLTVADATSVQSKDRKSLIEIAKRQNCPVVAIVLNLPEDTCQERNQTRGSLAIPQGAVRRQVRELHRSLKGIRKEEINQVHILDSVQEVDNATVVRTPAAPDRKNEHGPFDFIGDIHGCSGELKSLLEKLGYQVDPRKDPRENEALGYDVSHPHGRRPVFVGDLVDRGPDSPGVLRLVMDMVQEDRAICVAGNHENKLMRKLMGRNVRVSHGLAETLAQLEEETPEFRERVAAFLKELEPHYVLNGGRIAVAHAGIRAQYQGRTSRRVQEFCHYGETTGETDEFGLPVRADWAASYRGKAAVVYGHTPVPEARWHNNTINIDTGCVFGGSLTALRYPEQELVSVPAERVHYKPAKPIQPQRPERPQNALDLKDVMGRRSVVTKLQGNVIVSEEHAAAALETMSRFAVDPRWLVYLPPTMSPSETSRLPGMLEHPQQAFEHYRKAGVETVVCQEKHMGSRGVIVAGRNPELVQKRFGAAPGQRGACYTRTGRRFFNDPETEDLFLQRIAAAMERAGLWDELQSDWAVIDCEIMPWSLKAQQLLKTQYAPVAASARASLGLAQELLEQAAQRGVDTALALGEVQERLGLADRFADAYAHYCWNAEGLQNVRVAPFHIMASEGQVHQDQDHLWHMHRAGRLAEADPELIIPTAHRSVDLSDAEQEAQATSWWEELTAGGGEGMVVKPLDFAGQGRQGVLQPAVKCRGSEYLRIIYGPEYSLPENLERLRSRGLQKKRSMALREFALGLEGLRRFVDNEPLYRVHECAFAVLALESEPVDPAL